MIKKKKKVKQRIYINKKNKLIKQEKSSVSIYLQNIYLDTLANAINLYG
jgi:hypothetical protein